MARARTVWLRKSYDGYEIGFNGGERIHTTCDMLETVTGFKLDRYEKQRVRITIEPVGRVIAPRREMVAGDIGIVQDAPSRLRIDPLEPGIYQQYQMVWSTVRGVEIIPNPQRDLFEQEDLESCYVQRSHVIETIRRIQNKYGSTEV